MSVGVMEDYKLRDLRASHTLGWSCFLMVGPTSLFSFFKLLCGKKNWTERRSASCREKSVMRASFKWRLVDIGV